MLRVQLDGDFCAYCIGFSSTYANDLENDLVRLRSDHPNLLVQGVNAKFVASATHLRLVVQQTWAADIRGLCLADRREVDFLLRFACDTQISRALRQVGLSETLRRLVLVIMGEEREALSVAEKAKCLGRESDSVFKSTTKKLRFLINHHRLSRRALASTLKKKEDAVSLLLAEKAALLAGQTKSASRPASS